MNTLVKLYIDMKKESKIPPYHSGLKYSMKLLMEEIVNLKPEELRIREAYVGQQVWIQYSDKDPFNYSGEVVDIVGNYIVVSHGDYRGCYDMSTDKVYDDELLTEYHKMKMDRVLSGEIWRTMKVKLHK